MHLLAVFARNEVDRGLAQERVGQLESGPAPFGRLGAQVALARKVPSGLFGFLPQDLAQQVEPNVGASQRGPEHHLALGGRQLVEARLVSGRHREAGVGRERHEAQRQRHAPRFAHDAASFVGVQLGVEVAQVGVGVVPAQRFEHQVRSFQRPAPQHEGHEPFDGPLPQELHHAPHQRVVARAASSQQHERLLFGQVLEHLPKATQERVFQVLGRRRAFRLQAQGVGEQAPVEFAQREALEQGFRVEGEAAGQHLVKGLADGGAQLEPGETQGAHLTGLPP